MTENFCWLLKWWSFRWWSPWEMRCLGVKDTVMFMSPLSLCGKIFPTRQGEEGWEVSMFTSESCLLDKILMKVIFFSLKKCIGNSQHTYLLQLVLQQANFCWKAESDRKGLLNCWSQKNEFKFRSCQARHRVGTYSSKWVFTVIKPHISPYWSLGCSLQSPNPLSFQALQPVFWVWGEISPRRCIWGVVCSFSWALSMSRRCFLD